MDYTLICDFCGGFPVTPLPYFETGLGNAYRSLEISVLCSRCNRVAMPRLVSTETHRNLSGKSPLASTETI